MYVIAAYKYTIEDLPVYIYTMYTTKALKQTYNYFLNLISIENLIVDEAV